MWKLRLHMLWDHIEDFFIWLYWRVTRRRSTSPEQVGPRPDYEAIERLEQELGIGQSATDKARKKRRIM